MRAKDTANHVYASLRKEILALTIVPGQDSGPCRA